MYRQADGCAPWTGWVPEEPAWEAVGESSALLASIGDARAMLATERAGAPAIVGRLLALPEEARWAEVLGEPRVQTWGVAELLLEVGEKEPDPVEAARLLRLALGAAEKLDPMVHLPALCQDLRARIWAALGDLARRRGRLAEAERALRHACACLSQGSGDLLVEARLLEFEASVRQDEGRLGETAALLRQASSRFLEVHQFHDLARVLTKLRLLLRLPAPPGPPVAPHCG